MKKELFKQIPAVNDILESKQGESLIEKYSHNLVLKAVRSVLDKKRNTIAKTPEPELENMQLNLKFASLFIEIEDYIEDYLAPNLENVINATGTIVHTN